MQGWSFDARTVQPTNAFGAGTIPENWYKMIVRRSNIKPTNSDPQNSGKLELQCEVIEGEYKGRIVFWNLNLFNQSQQAVEIAYKQLAALCAVTGQFQVSAQQGQDTAVPMLHNIPFFMFVVVGQGNQGPINNVKGLRDINGNEPGKSGGAPPVQQPAPNVAPTQQWGAAPSAMSAPGGFGGAPAAPSPAPGAWGAPQGGPAPQGAPAGGGWSSGPAPGPAPQQPGQWGGQPQQPVQQQQPPAQQWGGAPAGGAPQGQPWGGAPQGQPWGGGQPQPQGQPGPAYGAPQGQPQGQPQQQWQPQGGQPGGPPTGAAPWGR